MGKGLVPAPWAALPAVWAIDDMVLATHTPSTPDLVEVLLAPEDRGGDLRTVMACTAPLDRHRIFQMIAEKGRDAPDLEWFADIADTMVAAATGWKRWEAAYVWEQTMQAWRVIDGEHLARGVDIMALPAGRATSVAFAWWRQALGKDVDEWKRWSKAMQREPRRVIRREAAQPMDPGAVAQLQGLIGRASARERTVPASTIRMPDQIP